MPIPRPVIFISAFMMLISGALLSGCNNDETASDVFIKKRFHIADSLLIVGKRDSAIKIVKRLRRWFKPTDPLITSYYCYLSDYHRGDTLTMNIYADSAVAFFTNTDLAKKYPNEYFRALLMKGDASFVAKEYSQALDHYDRARRILSTGGCDDGSLSSKIALIYFGQENYRTAAKYWAESYDHLQKCTQVIPEQKIFYLKQATLDNAGLAYQKAGMLDSAAYYYNLDLKLINEADSNHIETMQTRPARIVLYDNLGGLYLKTGEYDKAADYLTRSVSIPNKDIDGMRIPPFLKLAELYLKTGKLEKADSALSKGRILLNTFGKRNPQAEIVWNKLYGDYLYNLNQPELAYEYQSTFIRLKDSLYTSTAKLRRVDIEQELNAIHREGLLAEMRHQTKLERLYIGGISVAAIFFIATIFFITRILRESRRNHKETQRQNEQLQQTLGELENANKNFIRIMRIMAHDLRNPLSGIIGLANALLDNDLSDDSKHMVGLIETTGSQSLEMINELLKTGLADENEPTVTQQLDINELLADLIQLLQYKANEKQQQVVFEIDGPVLIEANYQKIWRVFSNLIINAIKFSHTGGVITVKLHPADDHILITVADNGIGIPDKDKDKVFEMFTEAKRPGTDGEQPFGLGLSISKKIIEKHNGKLWFESTQNVGTTFFIELPV